MANPTAEANHYLEDSMREQQIRKGLEQLNQLRHKEMASDTEKLLVLANQLKAEADKASKAAGGKAATDALLVDALRQAEKIEKLAHNVRERMRTSVVK